LLDIYTQKHILTGPQASSAYVDLGIDPRQQARASSEKWTEGSIPSEETVWAVSLPWADSFLPEITVSGRRVSKPRDETEERWSLHPPVARASGSL
jgi:hypothetical protein